MEVCRGLGRSGNHWRREIEWAEFLTGGEVVGEIRHVWGRDRGVLALGKLGTLVRCFCAPGRSSGASRRRVSSGAEERSGGARRGRWRCETGRRGVVAAGWRWVSRGVRGR